ncbi:MAG: histidine phosphatase family protein [Alphaproteobacteria bacterium]|nr:histidine phosphatase family protein [Alphaproteobacteria bacterium]
MTTVTRWWWVRHAPVINPSGALYGASEVPADVSDRVAFSRLAGLLPQGAVWLTSHLSRARATAAAIQDAGLAGHDPHVEERIGEQSFGAWHGRQHAEIAHEMQDGHRFWVSPAAHVPPEGESFAQVIGRVEDAVRHWTAAHAGRDIIAVSHGGPIRAALALALGIDPDRALSFVVENLSVTRIDHVAGEGLGGNWRVVIVNRTPACS